MIAISLPFSTPLSVAHNAVVWVFRSRKVSIPQSVTVVLLFHNDPEWRYNHEDLVWISNVTKLVKLLGQFRHENRAALHQ